VVRITRPILVDVDAIVAGIVVEQGADLVFDPDRTVTVRSTGNIIVEGRLTMRPSSYRITHRLVFENVDESNFQGGGMEPLVTDVGLWVMGQGRLDIRGSRKRAWTRAVSDVDAGDTKIRLQNDPSGWRIGDELVITPTLPPTRANFSTAYDEPRVKRVDGRTIRLSRGTRFEHPKAHEGDRFAPEVLNLTRNVRIEGTPSGRSHIFIHSSEPQTIKNAAIRHMGPRQPGNEDFPTVKVKGRYGLHIHMCGNGSRGSDVSGVVVRDAGSHAFVSHNSHGVTFKNCISHDTWDEPYWWDLVTTNVAFGEPPDNFANDITYERCVASLVRFDPNERGYLLSGFWLGTSTRENSNKCLGCVAVGIRGNVSSSGFHWPEDNEGVWVFRDCVAHNNAFDGIFTWQNTAKRHDVEAFTAYRNGNVGIEHGAYNTAYVYDTATLIENGEAGVILHSQSTVDPNVRLQRFADIHVVGRGITRHGFRIGRSAAGEGLKTIICGAAISGVTGAEFLSDEAPLDELVILRDQC